jgi:hypothetical protein
MEVGEDLANTMATPGPQERGWDG